MAAIMLLVTLAVKCEIIVMGLLIAIIEGPDVRRRFSLRSLMLATTLVALVLGIVAYAVE